VYAGVSLFGENTNTVPQRKTLPVFLGMRSLISHPERRTQIEDV
jgi:hypothetical protein